jgi:ribosomal protein L40E
MEDFKIAHKNIETKSVQRECDHCGELNNLDASECIECENPLE